MLAAADLSKSGAEKARTALAEVDTTGAFKRSASSYRNIISAEDPVFRPAAGRYHLYVSLACPWANRCIAVLNLKGLQGVFGVTVVHPTWARSRPENPSDTHCGWRFHDSSSGTLVSSSSGFGSFLIEGCTPDVVNGAKFVRDLYELSSDTYGKYTVPVLWDKERSCIVNNESSEIMRMLNSAFNDFATGSFSEQNLYPSDVELRGTIDKWNDFIYESINDGVYRCGFAKSQEAYESAVRVLFAALDKVEMRLGESRYITGSQLTESDIRLFMTLARFDEVYVVYFKCNVKSITDYPNLRHYCRELFQIEPIGSSIDMTHIKTHYFTSHPHLNPFAIIPAGPGVIEDFKAPHDRASKF